MLALKKRLFFVVGDGMLCCSWPFVVDEICLHRWLGYIGLLLFDVLICLLVLFGLIRNSKGTLIG